MTDNQGRTHTDVYLLAVELGLDQLLCLLRDRLQTIDKERGDTRNQLHHSSHGYTQEENLLDIQLSCPTNQGTYDDTENQWFAEHAKLLLQSLCIYIELRETRNHIQELVEDDGEWHETLAEWLRNRDSIQVVVLLKLVGGQVCTYQCNHIADDGCEVSPKQALAHHEVSYGTDECEMPVVPEVDVYRTGGLGNQHQEVDTQADWDNQGTHRSIISYGSSCRPPHIKHIQLQVIDVGDSLQRVIEVGSQQSCHHTQSHETHTYEESRLQSLSEFHANAQSDDREDDRHHHARTQTNDIAKYLFHYYF